MSHPIICSVCLILWRLLFRLSVLQPVGRYYINPLCPSEDYVSIVGSALMTADETGRFGVKGHSAAQRERLTLEWIWPPIGSRTSPRQTAWSGQNFLLLLGILKAVMLLWKLRSTSYIHTLLNSCGKINLELNVPSTIPHQSLLFGALLLFIVLLF